MNLGCDIVCGLTKQNNQFCVYLMLFKQNYIFRVYVVYIFRLPVQRRKEELNELCIVYSRTANDRALIQNKLKSKLRVSASGNVYRFFFIEKFTV